MKWKQALLLSVLLLCSKASSALEVIAHPLVENQQINSQTLRSIFSLRQTRWNQGTNIRLVVFKANHDMHLSFSRDVLQMFPYQLNKSWDRVIFSGLGDGPIFVNDRQEMLNTIANTPGAIGYIDQLETSDDVKIIEIK